jgi:hypothetical protein
LLATIVFDKFGQHIPLNRQSTRFKCEASVRRPRPWPVNVDPNVFELRQMLEHHCRTAYQEAT